MFISRAGLYWRTIRHLRPRQIWHQALRVVGGPSRSPSSSIGRWTAKRGAVVLESLASLGPVAEIPHVERTANGWAAGRLLWLGDNVEWSGDWRMQGPSPLWRYHLHYHEHLADAAFVAARSSDSNLARRILHEVSDWRVAALTSDGPTWDAYPTATRLVSWLRILAWACPLLPPEESDFLRSGIVTHTEHLDRNLEWHLDGNHLLRDAWALSLGAACVADSPVSVQKARALFERLLVEQVHADGWHAERTPMYHARAVRDAIEVERVLAAVGAPLGREALLRIDAMREALRWMLRADGTLWQLNDTALDHGVDLSRVLPLESSPAFGVRWFEGAKTAVAVDPVGDRLRIDLGSPAPSHQPGHAHAGALGFELDVSGYPLVVDGGVSGYDGDRWRSWLRGTSAHSTVSVDGRDQSELWATFRVGARARVRTHSVKCTERSFEVIAACKPYHGSVEHRRTLTRIGRVVRIEDRIRGGAGHIVEAFLHFAPEWHAQKFGDGLYRLLRAGVTVIVKVEGPCEVTLHRGECAPLIGWRARGFSDVVPAFALRLRDADYRGATWVTTITPQ